MRALLTVALLLPLSGCLSSDDTGDADEDATMSSSKLHSLGDDFPWETTLDDGVTIRGHIYLPEGEGPFATVLTYWPYFNAGGGDPMRGLAEEKDDGRMSLKWEWAPLMDAGFAVAAVNQRGTGDSDGCYSYMNHPANGPDANQVIEALSVEPWSNGAIGMYGISYGGATQFAALAADPPEAFKAAVPASGEWDEWNLLGRWGTANYYAGAHAAARDVQQGAGIPGFVTGPVAAGEVWLPTPHHLCAQTFTDIYEYQELWRTGDKSPFYEERDLREDLVNAKVPILATFGIQNGEGHILQSEGLWDLITHEQRHLILGQHGHAWTHGYDVFGAEYAVPWFDHFLRDGPAPVMNVVDYQVNTGDWRRADAWPPAGERVMLHLSGEGMVLDGAAAQAGSRQLIAQPFVGDVIGCAIPGVVGWTSPPLSESVTIAGNWFIEANVTATGADDATLLAELRHGAPGDTCGTLVQVAYSDLRHRGGALPAGAPFPTGEKTPFVVHSNPMAHTIPAGDVVHLAWARVEDIPQVETKVAAVDIHMGADEGSALVLNVVEGTLAFKE